MTGEEPDDGAEDDLTDLKGIGPKRAGKLADVGIETPADLRAVDKPVLLEALDGRTRTAENVLESAGHPNPSMSDVTTQDAPAADGGHATSTDAITEEPDTAEPVPVPDPGTSTQPAEEDLPDIRADLLRAEFGWIRSYFKDRESKHAGLQRKLNQAHNGQTFDIYLTKSVYQALGAGLFGAFLGLLFSLGLAQVGAFANLSSPVTASDAGPLAGLVRFAAANKTILGGAFVSLLLAVTFGTITWFTRYYYPNILVDTRRRNINITLPHAIVYMYALSFGGMDFVKVVRRTAETGDTYGEIGKEFDTIVTDIDMFGADLFSAIRNARNMTPSQSMEQFLDDMVTMLDSGGNVTEFLREEAEKQRKRAVREQERFLDTLELLSEVFIIGFVAAPIFFVVTLLMMSFLGQNTLPILFILMYAVLPLGMLLFIVLIATLSEPYRQPDHDLGTLRDDLDMWPDDDVRMFPQFKTYRRIRFRDRVRSLVRAPTAIFRDDPLYTLAVTVPVALVVAGVLWSRMGVTPDAFFSRSFEVGVGLLVVPFLVISVPLMVFHELDRRRKKHVARRLPDTLDILASANQMGLSLSESLELVSRNVTGEFADELRKVRNDIEWNGDVRAALLSLADRLQVPQLSRTCNILAEGTRSTGDLHKILSIAAKDTRQRYRLKRNRNQELQAYTTIVIIGFLVYMTVIVILDVSFLTTIAETAEESGGGVEAGLIAFSGDTISVYQALLFHSALIQGVGTGLISGKLTDNSVLSGLKYSIGLVVLTVLVFAFL